MREREDIEMNITQKSPVMLIIELLLDIRDLLTHKEQLTDLSAPKDIK